MKKLVLINHEKIFLNNQFIWLVNLSNKEIQEVQDAAKQLQKNQTFLIQSIHHFKEIHNSANIMLETMNSLWVTQKSRRRLMKDFMEYYKALIKKRLPQSTERNRSNSMEVAKILKMQPQESDLIGRILQNKQELVVSHSKSQRSLLYIIKKLSEQIKRSFLYYQFQKLIYKLKYFIISSYQLLNYVTELFELNIPTATPLVLQFNNRSKYQNELYLENQKQIKSKISSRLSFSQIEYMKKIIKQLQSNIFVNTNKLRQMNNLNFQLCNNKNNLLQHMKMFYKTILDKEIFYIIFR
ncbi:unnamed protein product [Paramecium sonneborni]|uniref:Uncharacterized protein n=1 Tax=Paramecium sonneborni TaxID=65129 RepID=A0A8S1RPZ4_9CILI|nr:unnamed protein product [Paramecium sonneborni]